MEKIKLIRICLEGIENWLETSRMESVRFVAQQDCKRKTSDENSLRTSEVDLHTS
jgi:hypothetical protein